MHLFTGEIARRRCRNTGSFFAIVVAAMALATSASAATTLSAAVNPSVAGAPGAQQPVTISLNTTVDNNGRAPVPVPVAPTKTFVQTLPAEFANALAGFSGCPESRYNGTNTLPGGSKDPSVSCPKGSIVGTGLLEDVSNAGRNPGATSTASPGGAAYIVKDATTGGLAFWGTWVAAGAQFAHILRGDVKTNSSGQTVITWDATPPEPVAALRVLEFDTNYNVNQSSLETLEPFGNTGCGLGNWEFSVTDNFIGGKPASQTAKGNVACWTAPPAGSPPAAPANTSPPTIIGSTQENHMLAESDGAWTGSPVPVFSRQWQVCDTAGANCVDIPGATATTYTTRSADLGHTIRVVVTATADSGSASATSAPTAVATSAITGAVKQGRTVGIATIRSRSAKVSADGSGSFRLSCSSLGACTGKYEIVQGRISHADEARATAKNAVLARGTYSVSAGSKSAAVVFKLSAKGKTLLRKHHGQLTATLDMLPAHGEPLDGPLMLKASASASQAKASATTFKVKIVSKTQLCGANGKFCGSATGTFGKCTVSGHAVPPKRITTLHCKGGTVTATGEIDEEKPPYLLGAFTLKGTGKWKHLKGKGRFKGHGGTNVFTYTGKATN